MAGVDLTLPAGKFVGLVGPNGAGKTTTLSMITGLLRPDQGRIEVAGRDVWQDPAAVKARIGVLPEGLRLFERLSGRELLAYTGRLRGLPGAEVDKRAAQLLDVLDLAGSQHKLVIDYSTGMRKKIGLAAALLHNPDVLFLDEPFEGVDPVSAQTIRGVLERYTASGATVVFSSHVMELVESLCDWVAVMAAGTIRAHGTLRRSGVMPRRSSGGSWSWWAPRAGTRARRWTGWAVRDEHADGVRRPAPFALRPCRLLRVAHRDPGAPEAVPAAQRAAPVVGQDGGLRRLRRVRGAVRGGAAGRSAAAARHGRRGDGRGAVPGGAGAGVGGDAAVLPER